MQRADSRRTIAAVAVGLAVAGALLALTLSHSLAAEPAAPEPAVLLAPPAHYLNDGNTADAPYDNPPAPTVDGAITPGEYAGAHRLTFPTYGGTAEAFIVQDAITLYIAFDSPDTALSGGGGPGPAFQVFLDTLSDRASMPQADDYLLSINKSGISTEDSGTGSGWGGPATGNWTAAVHLTTYGWQAKFAIGFAKLGITPPSTQTIGLGLAEVWTPARPHDWYWPAGADWLKPSSWGYLVSSSKWGAFYWKPGPWRDYAPSGMPDFDQWQKGPTYCGPYAAANSLWWFDSKFEPRPVGPSSGPPGTIPISDSYTLVRSYAPSTWDDHDPRNVISLTVELGQYFRTDMNPIGPGTNIYDMYSGLQRYLRDRGLWDDYIVTLVNKPGFRWIADEVMRSEDVVLLLGFWQEQPPGSGNWVRFSGHFVTVAGVSVITGSEHIALSDPAKDFAETAGMGRVLSGTLLTHYPPHPGPDPTIHNDAGNVSHDAHRVIPTGSPGGTWGPSGYVSYTNEITNFVGMNGGSAYIGPGQPVQTEVEWAVTVSPVADLWATKSVAPASVVPGDWTTFTLVFTNAGSLPAGHVVLTDTLPAGLVNPSWSYWTSNGQAVIARAGTTYVWNLPDLAWNEWGRITVRAQVSTGYSWPGSTVVNNNVTIGTSSLEQYQVPPKPNTASASFTVLAPVLGIAKTDAPDPVRAGGVLTYTITDTVPAGVTFAWADSGGTLTGNQVRWTGKTVNASGSLVVHFRVTVLLTTTLTTITNAAYRVSCAEGASVAGVPVTTAVTAYRLYLPLIVKSY
jgi:uncharacterized repeat protein (TIGR01451 family)